MSASNETEIQVLQLIFENDDWAGVGDAGGLRGSVTAGSVFISLHDADPGETGNQSTNEITTGDYAEYARQAVVRSGAAWTVASGNPSTASNVAAISFPTMTAGTGATATYFGVGSAVSGATALLFSGALGTSLVLGVGVTAEFAAGALTVTAE